MTCIIGYVDSEGVGWMCGDSASVYNNIIQRTKGPKIFSVSVPRYGKANYAPFKMLVGYSGSFLGDRIIRNISDIEVGLYPGGGLRWVEEYFAPSILGYVRENNYDSEKSFNFDDVSFVIVLGGSVIEILFTKNGLIAVENLEGFSAIGSGYELATGAMGSMISLKDKTLGLKSEDIMRVAIETVCEFHTTVSPPVHILNDLA